MHLRNLILLGLIFNATWLPAQEPSQPQQSDEALREMARHHVVRGVSGENVIFAPEAYLQELGMAGLDSLSTVAPKSADYLRQEVAWRREARLTEGETDPCSPGGSSLSHSGPPRESAPSLTEFLRDAPLAVFGQVIESVPGWRVDGLRLVTLIYVKVDEILACNVDKDSSDYRTVEPGDVVAVEVWTGKLEIDGEVLCSWIESEPIPPVGRQVVAVGFPEAADPYWINHGWFFEIHQDRVLPASYRAVAWPEFRPLWTPVHESLDPVSECPLSTGNGA